MAYDRPPIPQHAQCPLWVISGHMQCTRRCPLYPQLATAKADFAKGHVYSTPESGHVQCTSALTHWPRFSREGWLAVIFLGTVGSAIQFSLFTWALRWLLPSRAVIYLTLSPITAILLAGMMLGEAVTPVLIVGLVFVIAGIFVANWRDADKGAPVKTGTIQQE
jgi:threonine/homoserine efflux transporter RhtA